MAALIALMMLDGAEDYERGRQDAKNGLENMGPGMFTLGSRYDEGYEDGKRERDEG